MLRSLGRLMSVDPGFRPERVLTVRVPVPVLVAQKKQQADYYARMIERVGRTPGVSSVGLIAPLPLNDINGVGVMSVEGRVPADPDRQFVKLRSVSGGYFRAMGLALGAGRVFDDGDTAAAPGVVVINGSLARKYFPNENPLGKRISRDTTGKGLYSTIVGVVNDVRSLQLSEAPEPELYQDYRQFFFAGFAMTLVIRTQADDPESVAGALQKEIRRTNPEQSIGEPLPMRGIISRNVAQPRFYTWLLAVYAGLALMLAAAGMYGVLSYMIGRRTREIGIRMALGGSGADVVAIVLRHTLLLAGAGVAAGLAGGWALRSVIASQLYGVAPGDPVTFVSAPLVLVAAALAAAWVPARRAVRVDPVVALRCE